MIGLAAITFHPGIDNVMDAEIIRRAHEDSLLGQTLAPFNRVRVPLSSIGSSARFRQVSKAARPEVPTPETVANNFFKIKYMAGLYA
jgi:hypothetical protein